MLTLAQQKYKFKREKYRQNELTLPHDDLAFSDAGASLFASADNSSAKPQEQSLHAFLFPVVPQTKTNCFITWKSIFGD